MKPQRRTVECSAPPGTNSAYPAKSRLRAVCSIASGIDRNGCPRRVSAVVRSKRCRRRFWAVDITPYGGRRTVGRAPVMSATVSRARAKSSPVARGRAGAVGDAFGGWAQVACTAPWRQQKAVRYARRSRAVSDLLLSGPVGHGDARGTRPGYTLPSASFHSRCNVPRGMGCWRTGVPKTDSWSTRVPLRSRPP